MGAQPKEDFRRDRVAAGGQRITLTKAQAELVGDFRLCAGGFGEGQKPIYGENGVGPHRARYSRTAAWWDDKGKRQTRTLTDEQSVQCYSCRKCGRYMGCFRCLDTSLLCEIECSKCKEYANPVGYWQHGNVEKVR